MHSVRYETWANRGETKSCKKGSYAIGAEIGLHDDYGYSNIQQNEVLQVEKKWPYSRTRKLSPIVPEPEYCYYSMNYYLASVLNVRLYCSESTEQNGRKTNMIEGDRIEVELKDFIPTEQ